MGKNKQMVMDLKTQLCNRIENSFMLGGTIEFNQEFGIYLMENNSYDESVVKSLNVVKGLIDGKYLTGKSQFGDEFDDVSIYELDDIVEVAHILDQIESKYFKIVENAE